MSEVRAMAGTRYSRHVAWGATEREKGVDGGEINDVQLEWFASSFRQRTDCRIRPSPSLAAPGEASGWVILFAMAVAVAADCRRRAGASKQSRGGQVMIIDGIRRRRRRLLRWPPISLLHLRGDSLLCVWR